MRFVRAFTRADTGELVNVTEQETPFASAAASPRALGPDGKPVFEMELHELGLAEHFEPTAADTGEPCSPAAHLFQRLEHVHDMAPEITGMARFRAKVGHEGEVPSFHDIPTTVDAIKATLRAKGAAALPERAAHWLHFMGAFTDDDMKGARLPHVTLARVLEFDAMRMGRDPGVGSRAGYFKRAVRDRASSRSFQRALAHQAREAK